MALVTDQLVAAFTRTPFIKPPDLQREWTAMPRALVNFEILNGSISAKPVNDQAEVLVAVDLPVQFAYRLVSLNASLSQDVAKDWESVAYVEITNAVRGLEGGNTQRWPMTVDSVVQISQVASTRELWLARFEHVFPTDILQSRDGTSPVIVFKAANLNAAVGGTGDMDFLATFLEFDIEQAQRFPLHWPTMVYTRA